VARRGVSGKRGGRRIQGWKKAHRAFSKVLEEQPTLKPSVDAPIPTYDAFVSHARYRGIDPILFDRKDVGGDANDKEVDDKNQNDDKNAINVLISAIESSTNIKEPFAPMDTTNGTMPSVAAPIISESPSSSSAEKSRMESPSRVDDTLTVTTVTAVAASCDPVRSWTSDQVLAWLKRDPSCAPLTAFMEANRTNHCSLRGVMLVSLDEPLLIECAITRRFDRLAILHAIHELIASQSTYASMLPTTNRGQIS